MTATEKLTLLAKDLTKEFPSSPRTTLAGYVIAQRCLDKCRSVLAGIAGEYHSGCPLDMMFLEFAGIAYEDFKTFVATGATDAEVATWILEKDTDRPQIEIIKWNNSFRYKTIDQLPDGLQEYMETYIPNSSPKTARCTSSSTFTTSKNNASDRVSLRFFKKSCVRPAGMPKQHYRRA